MTADFDLIVVGSGPAGVSVSFPLVEAGLRVLMVDGGAVPSIGLPAGEFLAERFADPSQWRWMLGEDFHALSHPDALTPKLRTATLGYVFAGFLQANRIETEDFVGVGSLASGGLSNAWGCGVARLSPEELRTFPLLPAEIEDSYARVGRRIGISGGTDDDMTAYFGVDSVAAPPIPMDRLHQRLAAKYEARRARLARVGFRMGRSRIAVLSEDREHRHACDLSGTCLWGCRRRALYSAVDELPALERHPGFRLRRGFIVEQIVPGPDCLAVEGKGIAGRERLTAARVVLAAGTLASTRLALAALQFDRAVPVLSCPNAAFLLWQPSMLGAPRTRGLGLGQLSYALSVTDSVVGFGSTFSTTGLPAAEFIRHLPLRKREGVALVRHLMSSCVVGNIFLPGDLSASRATLTTAGTLKVTGGQSARVPALMAEAARKLRRAYLALGAALLPTTFRPGPPGIDIHYAGTLPMRAAPGPGETDARGALAGLEGLHIVDGAVLPALSEKSHTLTIMANADRIGRRLAKAITHR